MVSEARISVSEVDNYQGCTLLCLCSAGWFPTPLLLEMALSWLCVIWLFL